MTKGSSKGQVPFIEHNGRQFADSNFIIEHLRNHFKLPIDGNLTTEESAQSRAFTVLIEESLFRYDKDIIDGITAYKYIISFLESCNMNGARISNG